MLQRALYRCACSGSSCIGSGSGISSSAVLARGTRAPQQRVDGFARVVLTHSSYCDGLVDFVGKLREHPDISTITPARITRARGNAPQFGFRVSTELPGGGGGRAGSGGSGGFKAVARKGSTAQEVFVVTSLGREALDEHIEHTYERMGLSPGGGSGRAPRRGQLKRAHRRQQSEQRQKQRTASRAGHAGKARSAVVGRHATVLAAVQVAAAAAADEHAADEREEDEARAYDEYVRGCGGGGTEGGGDEEDEDPWAVYLHEDDGARR